MEEPQAEPDFPGRMELIIELLVQVTEDLTTEDFELNPSLLEGLRRIYAARFALRDCIDQHKARAGVPPNVNPGDVNPGIGSEMHPQAS